MENVSALPHSAMFPFTQAAWPPWQADSSVSEPNSVLYPIASARLAANTSAATVVEIGGAELMTVGTALLTLPVAVTRRDDELGVEPEEERPEVEPVVAEACDATVVPAPPVR